MPSAEPITGRCGARVKPKPEQGREGGYCIAFPVKGTGRCTKHGGSAPQVLRARDRRDEEARLEAAVVTYGLPVKVDPIDALLNELWRTQGAVLWLGEQVRELKPEALTWGLKELADKRATEYTGIDRTEAAGIHGLVELYFRERQHLAKVSKDCVGVGIALKDQERMSALADQLLGRMRVLAVWAGLDPSAPGVAQAIVDILRTGEAPPRRVLA